MGKRALAALAAVLATLGLSAVLIIADSAALADADPGLAFIRGQRGLFSNLAMTKAQSEALSRNHAIYCAGSGRINVAGMQPSDAGAIVAALRAEGCLAGKAAA